MITLLQSDSCSHCESVLLDSCTRTRSAQCCQAGDRRACLFPESSDKVVVMQAIFDCPEKAVEYCQNYRRNLPAFARRSFDFKPSRVVRLDQQAHFALLQRRSGRGLVLWARVERLHVNHFYVSFSFQFLEVVLYF